MKHTPRSKPQSSNSCIYSKEGVDRGGAGVRGWRGREAGVEGAGSRDREGREPGKIGAGN